MGSVYIAFTSHAQNWLAVKVAYWIAAEKRNRTENRLVKGPSYIHSQFPCSSFLALLGEKEAHQAFEVAKSKSSGLVSFGIIILSGKLPTYPFPKPTSTLTSLLGQNVGLGEGLVVLYPPQTEFPSESAKAREKDCTWAFGGQFAALSLVNSLFRSARVVKARRRHWLLSHFC